MSKNNFKSSISKNRYYLHKVIKNKCNDVRLVVKRKTIYVNHNYFLPALKNPHIRKLIDMGYCLQTEI